MWQILITVLLVAAALAYVIWTIVRSAKANECVCSTNRCSLQENRENSSLPCQNVQQLISAESLEESARNLASRYAPPTGPSVK